jgi:hypothetical protein
MYKLETKNKDENCAKLWSWWLSLIGMKLYEIKSLKSNYGCN